LRRSGACDERLAVKKIPMNKARQGRWGIQVLLVLVVGLALAGAVWLGLEFYGEAIDTRSVDHPGAVQELPAEQSNAKPDTTTGSTQ
jgi:hypothetical protein